MKRFMAALMCLATMTLTGCWRVSRDLSGDPRYTAVIGKQYRTKAEMVVYRFPDEKFDGISKAGNGPIPTDADLRSKPFPYTYYDTRILGVLPVGSEFKVSIIREEGSFENVSTFYYVEVTKSADPQWIGKMVNASTRIISSDDPLKFRPDLVEDLAAAAK